MSERNLHAIASTNAATAAAEGFAESGNAARGVFRRRRRRRHVTEMVEQERRSESGPDAAIALIGAAGLFGLVIAASASASVSASASADEITVVSVPDTQDDSDRCPLIFDARTENAVRVGQNSRIDAASHHFDRRIDRRIEGR